MISVSPFARLIIINPPPPRFPADGHVTASASPTATAASIALPPRRMISTPTRDAISLVEATIACRALTGFGEAARGVIGVPIINTMSSRIESRFIMNISSRLSVKRHIPCDKRLSYKERNNRSRTQKDSERDLHFHVTTSEQNQKHPDNC